jgi:sodium-dependent dicarboxylate transporter 2/3/5
MNGSFVGPAVLAGLCLALWLLEPVPVFVPTLMLLAGAPLVLGVPVQEVFSWAADPVLLLFFGGFVLGEAAKVHGLDRRIVRRVVGAARGHAVRLVAFVLLGTAFLAMWISGAAAAALVLAALRPTLDSPMRRPLLVAVAFGSNLGGMATPIGAGPNGIAIAAMEPVTVTFVDWMVLAVPLVLGSLVVTWLLVVATHRVRGEVPRPEAVTTRPGERPGLVAAVAVLAIAAWLTEPLHGIPAAVVSLGVAIVLFGTRLVPKERLGAIDWSTLFLVAGGILLGGMLEHAGLLERLSARILAAEAPPTLLLGVLLVITAFLSAVMSNTATATLFIPIAVAALPDVAGVPILVALAASFGLPFTISSPGNSMAAGEGATARDLLVPGLTLLAGGCAVLTFTGPGVLSLFFR